ncbi:hypothetical protein J4Q44_G00227730 [Coregonus suidteri]|uniref:Ciliogenesis-associated TTC17-interacting protein N-terminal domain-containing protein n=1 Tax=Coregonus suidteri TaxID=861788 RepID=A0AAN8QLH9_9TELE
MPVAWEDQDRETNIQDLLSVISSHTVSGTVELQHCSVCLKTFSVQGELGEFKITVERASCREHTHSHGAIDNTPCGTAITAYLSMNLETLEVFGVERTVDSVEDIPATWQ